MSNIDSTQQTQSPGLKRGLGTSFALAVTVGGVIGLGMRWIKFPLAPFIMGFVLWPIAEENLGAGLMTYGGSLWPLFTHPVSCTMIVLSFLMVLIPAWKKLKIQKIV